MKFYALYDQEGRIRQSGSSSNRASVAAPPGLYVIETDHKPDPATEYILGDTLVDRAILPDFDKTEIAADDIDVATIIGLPDPCIVSIDGVEHTITGGSIELASSMPATYEVSIDVVTHQARSWDITAT